MKSVYRAVNVTQLSEEWHWLHKQVHINPVALTTSTIKTRPQDRGGHTQKKTKTVTLSLGLFNYIWQLLTPVSCHSGQNEVCSTWPEKLWQQKRLFKDLEQRGGSQYPGVNKKKSRRVDSVFILWQAAQKIPINRYEEEMCGRCVYFSTTFVHLSSNKHNRLCAKLFSLALDILISCLRICTEYSHNGYTMS